MSEFVLKTLACRDSRVGPSKAIKRGAVPVTGPLVLVTGHRSPIGGPLHCLIVIHSPGFNCVGPQCASKNIGLGRT